MKVWFIRYDDQNQWVVLRELISQENAKGCFHFCDLKTRKNLDAYFITDNWRRFVYQADGTGKVVLIKEG